MGLSIQAEIQGWDDRFAGISLLSEVGFTWESDDKNMTGGNIQSQTAIGVIGAALSDY